MNSKLLLFVLSATLVCLVNNVTGFGVQHDMILCSESKELCMRLAEKKLKELGACHAYEIQSSDEEYQISFQRCFRKVCGEHTKRVQDLSKPYPDCCARCEPKDNNSLRAVIALE